MEFNICQMYLTVGYILGKRKRKWNFKWYNKYSKDLRKLACEKVVKLNGSENCSSVSLQCTSSGVGGSLLSSTYAHKMS